MRPLRASFGAWRAGGAALVARLARLVLASPRNWLDENFSSEKLKVMMAAWGMHLDFAPDIAGGALFPYLESMANQKFGMVIGKDGADTIIAAMVRALEAAGGEVRLGAEAVRVLTASGGASVVELADGRTYRGKPRRHRQSQPAGAFAPARAAASRARADGRGCARARAR